MSGGMTRALRTAMMGKNMNMKNRTIAVIVLTLAFFSVAESRAIAQTNLLEQVVELGLPKLDGRITTYYSSGAEARARKLQAAFTDMNAFFEQQLGIRAEATLAVLNSNDWSRVDVYPYGLGHVDGDPLVIFMPATSGGLAFHFMMRRKDAIPADLLSAYLETNHTTFEAVADDFVDCTGFHEVGHILSRRYGIDPKCNWLNEFVASYFDYAFIAERRPALKKVFDLLGRPSKIRPKHTTLTDFERLYMDVDDPGWYHGMFERHIQELYPKMGIQFLKELHNRFPAADPEKENPTHNPVSPEEVVSQLEKFAPGFESWAKGFQN
jgi:hypothetical protein